MSSTEILAILMLVAFFAMLMAGIPVALTLATTGFVFGFLGFGGGLFNLLPARIYGVVANYQWLAIPLFVFFTRIGQRGTLLGLLVVYVAQVAAVSIYMLRNYFDTIPASVEEAAAIDGCTRLRAMWHVSLPLAMPAIASNALFIFMIAWNEFLFALLFLVERRDNWTVSLGLAQLSGSIEVPTTVLMAGSVILTLPIIIMFFLSERWLAGGLTAGAEKG